MSKQKPRFLVGVEYYRAPVPPQAFWEEDFAAIRKAGLRLIRTFSYWNWMEPQRGVYELDDFDRFFELAAKNDLSVVFDLTLATHGACPEWMSRELGIPIGHAGPASPQGSIAHCYDHPKWKEYGAELIEAIVTRYKDAPNLAMWSVWDGVGPNRCYCDHSITAYKAWLKKKYTLDELNEKLSRRYRCWEDVFPPRSSHAIIEMMLFRQWQNENVAEKLKWQVDLVNSLDGKHETHAHAGTFPGSSDEICSREVDSWGFSCPTNNYFTSDDPYRLSDHFLAMDWSRSIGKDGKWWFDEIYSSMNPGGWNYQKRTQPEELTVHIWMAVAQGAEGANFWQYRPEYFTFEAPGLSLVGLNGLPLPRLKAVSKTIREIESIDKHLPLTIPKAEVAVVYHNWSHELCIFGDGAGLYHDGLTKLYRVLWEHNIPVDIITPSMDWEQYKVVYLPNTVLQDELLIEKITHLVNNNSKAHIVADGLLGTNASNGRFSYDPPEGLSDLLGVRALDYSRMTERDIREGENILCTELGNFQMTGACNYANLEPFCSTKAFATFGDEVVGVRTEDRRFTWITFTLTGALGGAALHDLLIPLIKSCGVKPPIENRGDKAIILCRQSALGSWLVFVFNLEGKAASVEIETSFQFSSAQDLLGAKSLPVRNNSFTIDVKPKSVGVVHCW